MVEPCRRCGQLHDAYLACTTASGLTGRSTVFNEDEALVGNIVADRYRIDEVLGTGSTGTVFAVEHVSFARQAAMKVLRPRFASRDLLTRVFHGEARALWSVSHACIGEVFDIGMLPDGAPFFVMERLDGETLAARIGRDRLSLAAAVDILMQLLAAIVAIHARDLLLVDLRPQNVYLARRRGCRPLVKLLDLGLSRLTPLDRVRQEWDVARTPEGAGVSTIPYYLSPERARGEHATPASDLFVSAIIFYEALTGERPFAASSLDGVLLQLAQGSHVPLHELRPDVSPELSALVTRALSANPHARPASAKVMQDELRAVFDGTRKSFGSTRASSPTGTATPPAPPPNFGAHDEQSTSFASLDAAAMRHDLPVLHDEPRSRDDESKTKPGTAAASSAGEPLPRFGGDAFYDDPPTAAQRFDSTLVLATDSETRETRSAGGSAQTWDVATGESPQSFDDIADKTMEVRPQDDEPPRVPGEDETETMKLTPELRARVQQMMLAEPATVVASQQPLAPHRGGKPPRQR